MKTLNHVQFCEACNFSPSLTTPMLAGRGNFASTAPALTRRRYAEWSICRTGSLCGIGFVDVDIFDHDLRYFPSSASDIALDTIPSAPPSRTKTGSRTFRPEPTAVAHADQAVAVAPSSIAHPNPTLFSLPDHLFFIHLRPPTIHLIRSSIALTAHHHRFALIASCSCHTFCSLSFETIAETIAPMASSSSDFFGELPPQRRRSMSDAAIEYTFVQLAIAPEHIEAPLSEHIEAPPSEHTEALPLEHTEAPPSGPQAPEGASAAAPPADVDAIPIDGSRETSSLSDEESAPTSSEHFSETETNTDPSSPKEPTYWYGILVTADNAQSLYAPDACLFVANLDRSRTATELTDEVQRIFAQIGECWVKTRFDAKNIPVAFAQYKTSEEADEAMALLQGSPIFGRACRIERARAPRTVYVQRRDGMELHIPMPMHQLGLFGRVEHFWTPNETERALHNLPLGSFFRFAFYQHCQDAVRALRNDEHHIYTLQHANRPVNIPNMGPIGPEVDPKAIYVGDLPLYINEQQLRYKFGYFGWIVNVEVRRLVRRRIAFAYIYFAEDWSATMALTDPYPYVAGEYLSRVEPKRVTPHNQYPGRTNYTYIPGNPSYLPRNMRAPQ
ncbi:hypothetical protein D6D26_04948 [Aureobasidium pullulans]|nr:hypothetical protein D6D26_04948 [Aureobasidium pullulans]